MNGVPHGGLPHDVPVGNVRDDASQRGKIDVTMWNPLSLLAAIYNRWSKKKDRRTDAPPRCARLRNGIATPKAVPRPLNR